MKVTLVSVGLLQVVVHPAAIIGAELAEKVTLVSVGLLEFVGHPAARVSSRVSGKSDVDERGAVVVLYIPPP